MDHWMVDADDAELMRVVVAYLKDPGFNPYRPHTTPSYFLVWCVFSEAA